MTIQNISDIVKLQLDEVRKSLSGSNLRIEITAKAIQWIARQGYDPQLGARPVKRLMKTF